MGHLVKTIKAGSKKVPDTTLVTNMGTALHCTAKALGLCQVPRGKCYAERDERQYPNVLAKHKREGEDWLSKDAPQLIEEFNLVLDVFHQNIDLVRINEASDFHTQKCVDKLSEIAEALTDRGIVIYGYTARKDLDFSKIADNITLSGSGFMIHNEFRYVEEYSGDNAICIGNCHKCNVCSRKLGIVIESIDHSHYKRKLKFIRQSEEKLGKERIEQLYSNNF